MVMGRDYHREYSRLYYHRKKAEYVEILGGKCRCGATENLQFDHIDRTSKKFPIGKLLNFSKEMALEELKKCQLLCEPCHIEKSRPELREVALAREAKRRVAPEVGTRS